MPGTAAQSELHAYFRRSACARAVRGVLHSLREADAGGLSVLALARLLAPRFSRSAVEGAVLRLRAFGVLRCCGWRRRSKTWRVVA